MAGQGKVVDKNYEKGWAICVKEPESCIFHQVLIPFRPASFIEYTWKFCSNNFHMSLKP